MNRIHTASLVIAGALAAGVVSPALAQTTAPQVARPQTPQTQVQQPGRQTPVVVYQNPERLQNANEVQQELRQIMSAYPPSLRQLLALDPSLLQREDYMAPYPALTAFLQQHPD